MAGLFPGQAPEPGSPSPGLVVADPARPSAAVRAEDLLDLSEECVLWLDGGLRVRHANAHAARGKGVPASELLGLPVEAAAPAALSPLLREAAAQVLASATPRRLETVASHHPGGWSDIRLTPLDGGVAIHALDVTERRRLEQRLHLQNRQQAAVAALGQRALAQPTLQELFDLAAASVAEVLAMECTAVLERLPDTVSPPSFLVRAGVGWTPGVVGSGRVRADAGAPAGYALLHRQPVVVPDIASDKRFGSSELILRHGFRSGLAVPIIIGDQPWGALAVLTCGERTYTDDDVHFLQSLTHLLATAVQRIAAGEELRRQRDRLEEAVEERTQRLADSLRELEAFSYTVSHDLRTPLRAVGGFSAILAMRHGAILPPDAHELLARIQQGAKEMGNLIEDLLELSRLGRVDVTREPVDLTAIAEQAMRDQAARWPGRQVRWSVQPGLEAQAQPYLLRTLVANLVENAWKFTRRTAAAEIQVGRDASGAFFIRDNGAGFSMEHANKLFRPFERLHAMREFEGTGIGLATVARIVHRHGGRAWAEGEPGRGATFRFTLQPADGQA